MNQKRRPVEELADAIMDVVQLPDTEDVQTIVLAYRDRLGTLASLRERHRSFVKLCAGNPDTDHDTASSEQPDDAFREARDVLQGEQLGALDHAELTGRLASHLRRISRVLAAEVLTQIEQEVEAKRIGEFRRVAENIGQCRLPTNSQSNHYRTSLSATADDPPADATLDSSDDSVVEFFIDQDEPLRPSRREMRQLRPVRQLFEQATPPLQRFLRLVSGTRYRSSEDLAEGRFGAVVLFHYVLESWTDDTGTQRRASGQGGRSASGALARLRTVPWAWWTVLAAGVVLLAFFARSHRINLKEEKSVVRQETAAAPPLSAQPSEAADDTDEAAALLDRIGDLERSLSERPTAADVTDKVSPLLDRIANMERSLVERPTAADVTDKVSPLLDRIGALERRLPERASAAAVTRMAGTVQQLEDRLNKVVQTTSTDHDASTTAIRQLADRLNVAMERTEADLETLSGDVEHTRASIKTLRDASDEHETELAGSLQRLLAAEERLSTLQPLAGDMTALKEEIARSETSARQQASDVDALRTALSRAEDDMRRSGDANEEQAAAIAAVRDEFAALQKTITSERSADAKRVRLLESLVAGRYAKIAAAQEEQQADAEPDGADPLPRVCQLVVGELHRLMETTEPHETENRLSLLTQRWELLWTATASLPYPHRAALLLDEIMQLAECKSLDTDDCEKLVADQAKKLCALSPSGDSDEENLLVALTFRATKFADGYKRSYSSSGSRSDTRRSLSAFVTSVGNEIERQRMAALREAVEGAKPPILIELGVGKSSSRFGD